MGSWDTIVVTETTVNASPIQTLLADYRLDASLATLACDPVGSSTETAGAAELS